MYASGLDLRYQLEFKPDRMRDVSGIVIRASRFEEKIYILFSLQINCYIKPSVAFW